MKPFEFIELKKVGKIQKFLDIYKNENALIEINNKLAKTSNNDISPDSFQSIKETYGKNILNNINYELIGLLREYITYQLCNKSIYEINFSDFKKLANALEINDDKFGSLSEELFLDAFTKEINKLIQSNTPIKENEEKIEKIISILNIPEKKAKEILDNERISYVKFALENVLIGGRYSPDEEKKFLELAENLDVGIRYDDLYLSKIEKAKKLWMIENEALPTIDPDIFLQKGEKCYFISPSTYYEYKKVTKSIKYAGPHFRFRITKGFYYRAGNVSFQRKTEDTLSKIDTGKLYITDKKIIFIGNLKTINVRLNKIIDMELFSDGIKIIKDTGNNIFIELENEIQMVGAIIAKAISGI